MREIPLAVRRAIVSMDTSSVNVSEFCREHGISRDRFYVLRRRFSVEGEAGIVARPRVPNRVTNRVSPEVEDMIVSTRKRLTDQGLDGGAHTIGWHLEKVGMESPSPSTIWRVLTRRGFIIADPSKRPSKPLKRFVAERANECWQIDATHWTQTEGRLVEMVNIIDDCTRVCVASLVVDGATKSVDAWQVFCAGAAQWGLPSRVLSDNGSPFTGGSFVANLSVLGIKQGHSSPYHPQTCGKVERFHQTQKKWLTAQPATDTIDELQTLLDGFINLYNNHRPHRSLNRRTPADVYATTPKTGPDPTPITTPTSVHLNKVDKNGRVEIPGPYSITVGAAWTSQTITTIRTANRTHLFANGTLIRQLVIDPTRRTQPLHQKPGRPTPP